MDGLLRTLDIGPRVRGAALEALEFVRPLWKGIDSTTLANTARVLNAFKEARVSEWSLGPSTGYGYGDAGREALDAVYAMVFGAEKALVRLQFVSGTHAVACALFGTVETGGELLSVTGMPYDTLAETISGRRMGLKGLGVTFRCVDVTPLDRPGEAVVNALSERTSVVFVQKSRGYAKRRPLSSATIGEIAKAVKRAAPRVNVVVDNCYGEFVEESEPSAEGADLVAGSLIKNPGGGLAPTGGYVAGRADLVAAAAERLTAPGIGDGVGATLGLNRAFFQGLLMAPHVVGEAVKGAVYFARLFQNLGFEVDPQPDARRCDIVQAIEMGTPEMLTRFCGAVQAWSPVDSHVTPEPWRMPGYDHDVIMAAGTFVQGSSIELSADAPFKEPYRVYVQGGLTKEHAVLAAVHAADSVAGEGR